MKKIITHFRTLLAIAMMLGVAFSTFAHDFEVDGVYYNYLDESAKTVAVTCKGSYYGSYTNEYTGSVTIPSSVTYKGTTYSVTSIGSSTFRNCTGLTSVTIGNSVTSIGSSAFTYCTGLTEVNISDLSAWCKISFGDAYANPICYAKNLKLNGSEIKDLVIPNDITEIKNYAFTYCTGLTSVTIPNSVTSIGSSAFRDCTGLTSVNYNAVNCTSMGSSNYPVFKGCSNLKTLNIGNEVKTIPNDAFSSCTGLTSVTIGNSVTSIGSSAFYNCSGLTEVNIPNSVTEIGDYAFYGTAWYDNQADGVVYINNVLYRYKGTMPEGTSISIKDGTVSISPYAFCNCTGLTEVNIPNSVTEIGDYAFCDCTGLTSVTIPNSVTSIGSSAFRDCTGLTSVNYNAVNCTSMGSSNYPVFKGCSNLKTLNIGNEVKTIPNDAFSSCTGLTSVTIPNSVTSIGDDAFRDCTGLTEVNIPNSVTEIGDYAFYNCSGLTSVTIGNSVTSIGSSAFYGCTGLTSVNYNAVNCTSMGSSNYPVFKGCSNFKTLNIGNEVKTIPNYAFYGCTSLTNLRLDDGLESITGLSFPDSPIETLHLGRNTLDTFMKNKTSLIKLTTGNNITEIPDEAFYGCTNLSDIVISNSVTKIGNNAFWGCNKLISSEIIDKTQTTVSIALSSPTKYQTGVAKENEKIASESNNVFIKGLKPNTNYTYNSGLIINSIFCDINSFAFTTEDLIFNHSDIIGTTSVSSKAYYEGDVTMVECGIKWGNNAVEYNNLDSILVYNLDPDTSYDIYYFLNTKEGGEYSTSWSVRTKSLTWNSGEFDATSTTSARLRVETTCDAIDGTGFEWKRYDAPESLTPNKAPCPIVNGKLTGSLRGLNSSAYYNCRPYYTSSSGKTYYGEWFTIFTGDANVYFEPEVSTSDKNIVVDNSAIINGYALAGSDDILEQGFEYWKSSTSPVAYSTSGVMIAKASGISMSATITNLEYNSTYRYRAYVKTSKGSFYGSEKELIIGDPAGVGYIESDVKDAEEVARYDIHGRLLNEPTRGVNIVIYSDGSTRKEIIKE